MHFVGFGSLSGFILFTLWEFIESRTDLKGRRQYG